jgi:cyclopropane fatty-acyl-phospholipid synthase-like methyltransferase
MGGSVVAAEGEERVRYHKDVPTLEPDHPWHRIHARIAPGDTVLDVGCGSGELGQLISATAASVDGIELNEDRAAQARAHLRTVVAAPGGPEADAALPGPYDVVIFADVLEHIAEPAPTLVWAASKLAPDGKILALIPNSANWKFRRKVLQGDWSYADTGYFDRDHVRFFDVSTARALGPEAGLRETAVEYSPGELPKPLNHWTRGAAFAAERRPNLFAGHVLVEWRAGAGQPDEAP